MSAARRTQRVRLTRSLGLLLFGLGILAEQVYQAAISHPIQPELIAAGVAFALAPAATRVDDAKRDRDNKQEMGEHVESGSDSS